MCTDLSLKKGLIEKESDASWEGPHPAKLPIRRRKCLTSPKVKESLFSKGDLLNT